MSDLQISHGWKIDRTSGGGVPTNVAFGDAETAPIAMVKAKPANLIDLSGYRRGRFRFFGTDTENDTATIHLYLVDSDKDPASGETSGQFYTVVLLCSVVITLGGLTEIGGIVGERIDNTQFFADTIVVTDGISTALDGSRNGSNTASYSPTGDAIAELVVADFGGAHWLLINYTTFTAARELNTLYNLIE